LPGRSRATCCLPGTASATPSKSSRATTPRTALTLQTYGIDGYQFFGTRTKTQGFLSASGGLAKTYAWVDGDPQYPLAGDGLFLGAGVGLALERFGVRPVSRSSGTAWVAGSKS